MTIRERKTRQPRVFISYAQCSETHAARVLALVQALRGHGIDAELDQYHKHELIDWPRWCREQLQGEHPAWVLKVCSAAYRDRLEGRVDPHIGKGVFWEGALIDDEIYAAKANRRFIPVLLDDEPEASIPAIVRGCPRQCPSRRRRFHPPFRRCAQRARPLSLLRHRCPVLSR